MILVRWTCAGKWSGCCGHLHISREKALDCCRSYDDAIGAMGGESDRQPTKLKGDSIPALQEMIRKYDH